jgi:hypothetical protein
MEKKEALRRWQNLEPDQPIVPHFTPIAADARGSTFGACGIRISGNPEFIDAVLSRLKDLLSFEAGSTRLSLSRQPVKTVAIAKGDSVVEKQWKNADTDAETCYIQVRERTARTRQRKVREQSDELPVLNENEENELLGMPDGYKKTKKQEPMPLILDESKVVPMTADPYRDKPKESPYPDDGFFVATDED